ncbi:TlpA family protein disulfide reductase [Lachnotalea glycerini]|uniref:TlpA family protein disulfide reductase n=1 Tax=Lachnotalea glycerini TaxID=1763509 RepID=UPI001A9A686D|nr:hypothetical protein [Lachnotalea glycerini]
MVLGISVLGRSNYFSKNEEITLINQNKEEVIYKSDKDVLVVSTICATCKEELDQLSKSSKSEQEQVNIIVMSTFEQACAFLEQYDIQSDVYVDEYGEFKSEYGITTVPKRYQCVNKELVEVDLEANERMDGKD